MVVELQLVSFLMFKLKYQKAHLAILHGSCVNAKKP